MRCEYCDVEVTQHPDNGICVCCGGKLPPRPSSSPVQPVHIGMHRQFPFVSGVNCCPKCRNINLVFEKRGFSWGLGILGFFLIPVFGIFLGFCGSGKSRIKCTNCNHKWKRN